MSTGQPSFLAVHDEAWEKLTPEEIKALMHSGTMPWATEGQLAALAATLTAAVHTTYVECGMADKPNGHLVLGVQTAESPFYLPLCERSFTSKSEWRFDYTDIARGKATISGRTGLPTRYVHSDQPRLLVEGDVEYWGSEVRQLRYYSFDGQLRTVLGVAAYSGTFPATDAALASAALSNYGMLLAHRDYARGLPLV